MNENAMDYMKLGLYTLFFVGALSILIFQYRTLSVNYEQMKEQILNGGVDNVVSSPDIIPAEMVVTGSDIIARNALDIGVNTIVDDHGTLLDLGPSLDTLALSSFVDADALYTQKYAVDSNGTIVGIRYIRN